MIKAECHTDDYVFEVEFDAFLWLRQASDEEIVALANCDWSGDYPADQVALFCQDHNPDLKNLFDYLERVNEVRRKRCGFEVWVDADAVRNWVRMHRPCSLLRKIKG